VILKHLPSFNVAVARLLRVDPTAAPVVIEFCHKFQLAASEDALPGLCLHRVDDAKSRDVWSARASQELRVILRSRGPAWYAAHVGHHDEAYKWAERTAIEIPRTPAPPSEPSEFDQFMAEHGFPAEPDNAHVGPGTDASMLFDPFDDRSLEQLGVPHVMVPMLRRIATIDEFIDRTYGALPEGLGDRLFAALSGDFATVTDGLERGPDPARDQESLAPDQTPRVDEEALRILAEHPHATWAALPDAQQLQIVERSYKGPVLVLGPAGSGKTAIALHRARFLARQGKRVLLTTYTRSLTDYLKNQLGLICQGEVRRLIDVCTLDHVAIQLSGYENTLFSKEFLEKDDFQRTCTEATGQVRRGREEVPWDAIIVDEAQDLDDVRAAFLQALSKGRRKWVMLLGDPRQRLYSEPFDLEARGFEVTGRVFHLDTVYRTTRPIVELGEKVMATADAEDYVPPPGASQVYADGDPVEFVALAGDADELVWIALRALHTPSRGGRSVTVLARTNQRIQEIRQMLKAVNIWAGDGIGVRTMHGAKGLEFDEVFVTGVDAERLPNPWRGERKKKEGTYPVWLEQERNLLHVAVTRASQRVVVSWFTEPSPFLAKALEGVSPARGLTDGAWPDVSLDTSTLEEDPAGLRQLAQGGVLNAQQIAAFLRPYAQELILKGRLK
jgi:hypothetical protein